MNAELSTLAPQPVWHWFSQICAIPHPTFHEKALGDFIVQQAQAKGLEVKRDEIGNILIKKKATPGFEQRPRIAVQAHIDMVAQKGVDSPHNFEKDPIQTRVQDGWVFAQDTTLGADNGIGAAMGLAVIFSDDISHPDLDLVLTVEEEIGMGGARVVSPDWLSAPYLVNLDSEDEGILFVGCAGGRDVTFSLDFSQQATQGYGYELIVSGLKGGHSGIDIDSGRANANLILARVLSALYAHQAFQLADIRGGNLRNVITREAHAVLVSDKPLAKEWVTQIAEIIQAEYAAVEPTLNIALQEQQVAKTACSLENTRKIIDFICAIPNGVMRMSDDFAGVVETSSSMGVLVIKEGKLQIRCLMRSLLETPKDELQARMQSLARLAGVEVEFGADYPSWKPEPQSPLLAKCVELFTQFYGKQPTIEVMHAGLECGILKGQAPAMEMISFGPNIRAAHSPKECVEIASVAKCWDVFCALLKTELDLKPTM